VRLALLLLMATAVGTTEPQACRYIPAIIVAPHQPTTVAQYAHFIEQFEGRRLSVYRDSRGRYTIGAGHRCARDHPALTNAQVDLLLVQDVIKAVSGAKALVPRFDELPATAQFVVVDMIYNLGRTGFSEFADFRSSLSQGNWRVAARALRDSDWYRQVPARSQYHVALLESL
jgi:lysozyme